MAATLSVTETLETTRCWCGAPMALPSNLLLNARRNGTVIYCPATGHTFSFNAEIDKLRKRLDYERSARGALEDQLRAAERRTTAAKRETSTVKGQLTKERKRAKAGMCPCCKRSFVQLANHMKTKHPSFDPAKS